MLTAYRIEQAIFLLRGQKVMLSTHLAELYQVEPRILMQAVRRNRKRFPGDFMFELTKEEFDNWRSQIVTSNSDRMGWRHPPMAFTEQGVAMLSSVLRSKRALHVSQFTPARLWRVSRDTCPCLCPCLPAEGASGVVFSGYLSLVFYLCFPFFAIFAPLRSPAGALWRGFCFSFH